MAVLQNNTKKAAAIGVAAIAAAVLALGAGTYAAFTDTETGAESTLAAGTLDLTVGSVAATSPTTLGNLAPGSNIPVTVTVDNAGSVDGSNLTLSFTATGDENGCAEPETTADTTCTGGGELAQNVQVWYAGVYRGTVLDLTNPNNGFSVGGLPALDAPRTIDLQLYVPTNVGNEIMTDKATVAVVATLTQ